MTGRRRTLLVVGSVGIAAAGLFWLLGATAGAQGTSGTSSTSTSTTVAADPQLVAAGRDLYLSGCVSCHGIGGEGSDLGPSLARSGAAYADFMLRTGRMPLAAPASQAPQKPPAYDDGQIRALVAYVASIGDGPPIPDVDPSRGDLSEGAELFLGNCASCHNAQGIGGALSYGNEAPSLLSVHPTQIGEAVRVGPGQMPVFGPTTLTSEQVDSIARYVGYLQDPQHPGGLRIGGAGPVPEGFVAWLVGIGSLLVLAVWITREHA